MTTPYNTGKVSIGSRYTPRIHPTASQGFSGPHKRRFFDKPDRVVLGTCVLAVAALAVILLAGCSVGANVSSSPKAADDAQWETFGPDKYGVVCYRKIGFEGVSCLRVSS